MLGCAGIVTFTDQLAAASSPAAQAPGGSYHALAPVRLVDTRIGLGARKGIVGTNSTIVVTVSGRGGVPAAGRSSVVLNVTVTDGTAGGYALVYASNVARPKVSNLNYAARQSVANLIVTRVDPKGRITIAVTGATHVLVDVEGWFSTVATASDRAGLFHALPRAARLADTRTGSGIATLSAGSTRVLQVAARGGIPEAGVAGVIANITALGPKAAGYVTAFPADTTRPGTSTLNVRAGETRGNRAFVRLSASGSVSLFSSTQPTSSSTLWAGSPQATQVLIPAVLTSRPSPTWASSPWART